MTPSPSASPPDHADVRVLPPILYGSSILLAVLAKRLVGGSLLPDSPARWGIGALLVAVGLSGDVLFLRSFRRTGQHPNPRTPTPSLVLDGPYRFTRNPAYVGVTLTQVGLAFLLANPWLLGVLVVVLPVMHYGVILREEAYLERKFGSAYLEYKARVRRWL